MSTDTQYVESQAETNTEANWADKPDMQSIGQKLFYQRHIRHLYTSSAEYNPKIILAWRVFGERDVSSDYTALLAFSDMHHGQSEPSSLFHVGLDEEFKDLARHVLRKLTEYNRESEFPEIHDFREAGVSMDLDRAEELCRKMMEK